jgi:predicted nucleotidyltransferase
VEKVDFLVVKTVINASIMKTISPVIRKELIRRLVDEFQPEMIYLFGSFAWGRPNEDSDMDLLVIVPESRENPIQRAGRAQRSLLGVKAAVEVLVKTREEFQRYSSVKASLEAQISREGKLLYGRKMVAGA